jgi:mannose-6-phosphate isomerase-like protein (cupin superfamily)
MIVLMMQHERSETSVLQPNSQIGSHQQAQHSEHQCYHQRPSTGRSQIAGIDARRLHDRQREKEQPMTTRISILKQPNEGRTVGVVGDVYRFLATGADTDGKYALWEAIVPPGGGPPPHVHSREEEGFYILEGEITFTIGDKRLVATAGVFANMPVGTPHSFKNESGKPARMLISVAPAGLEEMFFEVGVSLAPGATAPPPSNQDIEKLLAVAPRYGIEIRLPKH